MALHPHISFIHVYPGMVCTRITTHLPVFSRLVFGLLFAIFGSSPDIAGNRLVHLLIDPEFSEGVWFRGSTCEDVERNKWSTPEGIESSQ